MSQIPWYVSWSWNQHLQPKCESQDIPTGSQAFTSNLGFTYALASVSQNAPQQNPALKIGSLSYLNQTLNDCRIDEVHFELKKVDQTPSGQGYWWSWADSFATATVHCTISGQNGPVYVSFTTTYKPATSVDYDYVIRSNHTYYASMWWATRLLNAYWYSTLLALGEQPYTLSQSSSATLPIWMRGGITFTPNMSINDIKSYEYFQPPIFYFVASNGSLVNQISTNVTSSTNLSLVYNNQETFLFSDTLTQSLSWAKIMCSALLVDLGQKSSPNFLNDPNLLQYILQHPDDTYRNNPKKAANATRACNTRGNTTNPPPCYNYYADINMFAPPDTTVTDASAARNTSMIDSYNAFHDKMGPLGTSNTTIFTQYACEVPKMRPIGTVIITVLVADLVFLQACWVLLKWFASSLLERPPRYPDSMYCLRCSGDEEERSGDNVPGEHVDLLPQQK